MHGDALILGARYYSNTAAPPFVQGFFDGDVAEVLLFRRALKAEEAGAVDAYLHQKYAGLAKGLASGSRPLGPSATADCKSAAGARCSVPGFTVRELPVRLPNINNVRYRRDGKLVALGDNGNVYLLSDKDGDGLEDTVEVFWENKTGNTRPHRHAFDTQGIRQGGWFCSWHPRARCP